MTFRFTRDPRVLYRSARAIGWINLVGAVTFLVMAVWAWLAGKPSAILPGAFGLVYLLLAGLAFGNARRIRARTMVVALFSDSKR
jgi:hypothetical protein